MSKSASQYLREVKKRIPCSGSQKTEFLCQLEAEVIYYCEDHDNVDFAILSEYFGSPDDVARDFLAELGESTLSETIDNKQRLIRIAILIVIVVAGVSIYTDYKQQQALDTYYIESITQEGPLTEEPAVWVLTENNGENVYWEYNEEDNLWIEESNAG